MKRKKIEIPVLKITKTGKPYKRSLEKVRKFVKENFADLKKENLPKQVQGYYAQIESGKKRGEANKQRLKNPETGKFLTSGESKAVKDLVRSAAKEIGIEQTQLIENKDLYRSIVDKALNDKISITKDTDLAIDFLKRQNFKTIILVDQNGKEKKVPIEKAILILKENQKKVFQTYDGKAFGSWHKLTYTTSRRQIKIHYVLVKNETIEQLKEIIERETENGNYGVYGS